MAACGGVRSPDGMKVPAGGQPDNSRMVVLRCQPTAPHRTGVLCGGRASGRGRTGGTAGDQVVQVRCRPAHPPGRIHIVLVRQPAGFCAEVERRNGTFGMKIFFRTYGGRLQRIGGYCRRRLRWNAQDTANAVCHRLGSVGHCGRMFLPRGSSRVSCDRGLSRRCRYRRIWGLLSQCWLVLVPGLHPSRQWRRRWRLPGRPGTSGSGGRTAAHPQNAGARRQAE